MLDEDIRYSVVVGNFRQVRNAVYLAYYQQDIFYDSVDPRAVITNLFYHEETPKIIFHVPQSSLPMETMLGQKILIKRQNHV